MKKSEKVMAVLFCIGTIVASIGLVVEGFNESLCNPRWLSIAMRTIGFIGCVVFPFIYGRALAINEVEE